MRLLTLLIMIIIFFPGCSGEEQEIPAGIVSRDSMVTLLTEVHIAEATLIKSGSKGLDINIKSAYLQQVLNNAGVDTTRFLRSFDFYSTQPEMFAEMYEQVVVEISKRQSKAKVEAK